MVWSSLLRTLHWAMALCTVTLVASGWLMLRAPAELGGGAAEVHRNIGFLLLAALAARLYLLLFGQRAEQWRDFIPWSPQHRAALQTLRFYLTGGRSPLPSYYAHNPLWGPIYLALFAVLAMQGLTGLFGLMDFHRRGLPIISGFVALHVLAAFLHDWKGHGSDVSAMINGHRVFVVKRPEATGQGGVHVVSLESLLERRPDPGKRAGEG
jgi:Ni/Fe-hydrogenase 1 B-type cytochrome subunit